MNSVTYQFFPTLTAIKIYKCGQGQLLHPSSHTLQVHGIPAYTILLKILMAVGML